MFRRRSSLACVVGSCDFTGASSSSRWNLVAIVCIRYAGEPFITESGVHSEVSKRMILFHEEHSSLTFVRLDSITIVGYVLVSGGSLQFVVLV